MPLLREKSFIELHSTSFSLEIVASIIARRPARRRRRPVFPERHRDRSPLYEYKHTQSSGG